MSAPSEILWRWNTPDDVAAAAAFAARVIGAQESYISHGEIQVGLSMDGRSWIPDLAERYANDFADRGDRDLLVGRDSDGAIVGMLMLAWHQSPEQSYAVIEDMAVDPERRGGGFGGEMLAMAQQRIRDRQVSWVFLESGLGNEEAHRFFERAGFAMTSHVFARRLD